MTDPCGIKEFSLCGIDGYSGFSFAFGFVLDCNEEH